MLPQMAAVAAQGSTQNVVSAAIIAASAAIVGGMIGGSIPGYFMLKAEEKRHAHTREMADRAREDEMERDRRAVIGTARAMYEFFDRVGMMYGVALDNDYWWSNEVDVALQPPSLDDQQGGPRTTHLVRGWGCRHHHAGDRIRPSHTRHHLDAGPGGSDARRCRVGPAHIRTNCCATGGQQPSAGGGNSDAANHDRPLEKKRHNAHVGQRPRMSPGYSATALLLSAPKGEGQPCASEAASQRRSSGLPARCRRA
jgi:hypothetical protein